jgi:RNA polymerase sigma factor (sigma-70 family)
MDPDSRFGIEVVERYERSLGRLVTALLGGDTHGAEDVVADVFAQVWPRWKNRRIENLEAYLYRSAVNGARRHQRRRARSIPSAYIAETVVANNTGPVADRHLVASLLLGLGVQERAVICLRFLEDLSVKETAERLGIAEGTVKSRLSRAIGHMRMTGEGLET